MQCVQQIRIIWVIRVQNESREAARQLFRVVRSGASALLHSGSLLSVCDGVSMGRMKEKSGGCDSRSDAIIHDAFRPSVAECQSGLVRCSTNSLEAASTVRRGGEEGRGERGGHGHAERECRQ